MSLAGAPVAAERVVAASPPAVFAFLADLENHWLLADRFVEVRTLERPPEGGPARGGTVMIRGPVGLRRSARTGVIEAVAPSSIPGTIAGTASVGRRTEAGVRWTLTPAPLGTRVRLEASLVRAGPVEAVLLAAGGRWWLERRFASILETLAHLVPGEGRGGQDSSA